MLQTPVMLMNLNVNDVNNLNVNSSVFIKTNFFSPERWYQKGKKKRTSWMFVLLLLSNHPATWISLQ